MYPPWFDSDPERRFAILLEDDSEVLKWFKPTPGQFQIYDRNGVAYEPDFVVETKKAKYLCEPKRADLLNDGNVQEKANAAAVWCAHATKHAEEYSAKPWWYLLIPHTAIKANMTLQGLAAVHTFFSKKAQ